MYKKLTIVEFFIFLYIFLVTYKKKSDNLYLIVMWCTYDLFYFIYAMFIEIYRFFPALTFISQFLFYLYRVGHSQKFI